MLQRLAAGEQLLSHSLCTIYLPFAALGHRQDELTQEQQQLVRSRLAGVQDSADELKFMLATAVARNQFIAKYGMQADYGVSDDVDSNPLAQLNQAECLLALFMLHKEGKGAEPAFIDADKLQVLRGQ